MNYYEHHLGDYDGATAHLSWAEDCAYRRLLCLYYRTEAPIPAELRQVHRLVRAASKPERDAVEQVLQEFFTLEDDGWHNARCDEDIAEFHELEPEREAKRENTKERQRRSRERRKALFDALRGHDIVPAFDAPMKQLETLLSQVQSQGASLPVTRDITVSATGTHTHLPIPNNKEEERASPALARVAEPVPSPAGASCKAIKAAGIIEVNPSHPKLLALLAAGVTPQELADTAAALVAKGKGGFALLLATVEGQRRDAAAAGAVPAAPQAAPVPDAAAATQAMLAKDRQRWDQVKADPAEKARVAELLKRSRAALTGAAS